MSVFSDQRLLLSHWKLRCGSTSNLAALPLMVKEMELMRKLFRQGDLQFTVQGQTLIRKSFI
jgi:hypothetical protein